MDQQQLLTAPAHETGGMMSKEELQGTISLADSGRLKQNQAMNSDDQHRLSPQSRAAHDGGSLIDFTLGAGGGDGSSFSGKEGRSQQPQNIPPQIGRSLESRIHSHTEPLETTCSRTKQIARFRKSKDHVETFPPAMIVHSWRPSATKTPRLAFVLFAAILVPTFTSCIIDVESYIPSSFTNHGRRTSPLQPPTLSHLCHNDNPQLRHSKRRIPPPFLLKASRQDPTDFSTALAIVPPIKDWDRLQRARHFARDPVFQEWPPAIRLFHPFLSDTSAAAFDVAQVVEDLELEPFTIRLNTWVIVPHVEAMQAEWNNLKSTPNVEAGIKESSFDARERQRQQDIQDLITAETEKANKKHKKNNKSAEDDKPPKKSSRKPKDRRAPAQVALEQQAMMDEDGGPCILCLEPDEESKHFLVELREALQEGLNLDSYSSPSSIYSWKFVKDIDMGYRPLIPMSKFDSFQAAMDVARRLKGLWGGPIEIEIKDLHIISCKEEAEEEIQWERESIGLGVAKQGVLESKDEQVWGCNAKIMLVGEEIEQDEDENKSMMVKLVEDGEVGGGDISFDYTILEDEEESTTDIERWLDDDEGYDEGMQIVLGRTHFFTGEQRAYSGMPATSATDAKDRALGEAGSVSGASRRRGSATRQGASFEEGEYGRRERDFLPWGMRKRVEKEQFATRQNEDEADI